MRNRYLTQPRPVFGVLVALLFHVLTGRKPVTPARLQLLLYPFSERL